MRKKKMNKQIHFVLSKTLLLVLTSIFGIAALVGFKINILVGSILLLFFLMLLRAFINAKKIEQTIQKKLG